MARINPVSRIVPEDFKPEEQPIVSKLAFVLNNFLTDITNSYEKGITIDDNLAMEYRDFTVTVNASGVPNAQTSIRTSFTSIKGVQCVTALNYTTPPTAHPFVGWNQVSGSEIRINHVTGLVPGVKYTIRVLIHT